MKKILSVILVFCLMLSFAVPVFAGINPSASRSQIPIIRISGDGEALYNADGEKIFHYKDLADAFSGSSEEGGEAEEDDNSSLYESIANVLMPFFVDGVMLNNWEPYYENLQKEISELFGDSILDENGNPVNGTGISDARKAEMEYDITHDMKEINGFYSLNDYYFRYDWRLDPTETADLFHEYIQGIKTATNSEKVSIVASCLGTSVVVSYIAKYGMDDIHGVGFDGTVCNGAEILSQTISGKFNVDANAINRLLKDSSYLGWFNVDEFIIATIDLLEKNGTIGTLTQAVKDLIYYKVVEGVTSALALSTFYTWPNYWSAVSAEDYDTALNYVFGKEGSEKRTKYAGLIEKIENYNTLVRKNMNEVMLSIKRSGANVGIISKYGYQIIPICEAADAVADQFASVAKSSFGATTSTIYDTLSDEYIAEKEAKGLGKYISPDKQIDASTCLYPDYTWFVKGATHSNWTSYEMKILYDVVSADRQLTVDDFEYTQFFVYDTKTDTAEAMNEENCDTYVWEADSEVDKPITAMGKLTALLNSFIVWIKLLVEKLSALFS